MSETLEPATPGVDVLAEPARTKRRMPETLRMGQVLRAVKIDASLSHQVALSTIRPGFAQRIAVAYAVGGYAR
jgi:ABC-type dipeptide/oligopeptide/nickel transport system ATPase subunit